MTTVPHAPSPRAPAEAARELVLRHGWNAAAYSMLDAGCDYWFAPRRDAVVGFVRHAGVRVVAGVPVAREADLPRVAAAFEADARHRGEGVCYFGAEDRFAGRLGHARLALGAQPVWDPRRWPEVVRRRRTVRAQLARARRHGVRVERWRAPSPAAVRALRAVLRDWHRGKPLPALGFLLTTDVLVRLGDRRLLVALQGDHPVAFLVAAPVPVRRGWLVEHLVRSPDAPQGSNERLVDALMRHAAAEGSSYVTLGLAPLSRRRTPVASDGTPAWLRWMLAWLRAHGRRFYDFGGLEAFKAKHAPDRWDPIYALSTEPRTSVRTVRAVASAFAGGDPWTGASRALGHALEREAAAWGARLGRARPGGTWGSERRLYRNTNDASKPPSAA